MSVPLFAPSAPRGGRAQRSPYLVQFKAGKMTRAGTTVASDRRKGYVYLFRGDDSLLHFAWRERDKTAPEDDFIVFPDDTEFVRVPQCTTGRVYVFKLKGSGQKEFYWMQEPKEDNDEDLCKKVNATLNNTAAPSLEGDDEEDSGGGISDQQVLQFLTRRGMELDESGDGEEQPPSGEAPAPLDREAEIARIMAEIARTSERRRAASRRREGLDLRSIVTPEAMRMLLANEDVQRQLMPHLPESLRNPDELRGVLSTPQFQHALSAFNAALSQGELGAIMRQFGVSEADAGTAQGVEAFLRALQRQQRRDDGEGGQEGNGGGSGGGDAASK